MLTTYYPAQHYPDPLRRIRFYDTERQKRLVFLTNNFQLPPETIAQLYNARWRIELFFKWIKQHLFVYQDGRARWRDVTLGLRGAQDVAVLQGLSAGERVVRPAEGRETALADGQRIALP